MSERSVELKKSGAYTAIMTFSEGEDTKTQYITPFGNMEFDVKTYYVKKTQNDDFIVLELKYDLLSPETVMSKHEMIIKIKPAIS